jgi:hypothetical protein
VAPLERLTQAWSKLRNQRSSGRAEALSRVAFAAVLLVQVLWLREDVVFFYSNQNPWPARGALTSLYSESWVQVAYWLWLISALLLLVGALTRVAAVSCFVCCVYFLELREPAATHAADWLILSMAFGQVLLPSNRFFALDQRFSSRLPRDVPAWPLRLNQLQLAFFYFTAGTSKLADGRWLRGHGFSDTFGNPLVSHLDLGWLVRAPIASGAINYAVIAWECAMPLLLLWRRTRLWAVLSAVVLLLIIDIGLPVGWFSWFCLANLCVLADDLQFPEAWLRRFPWLAAPAPAGGVAPLPSSWRRAISAFLVFHSASFALTQVAYGFLAAGNFRYVARLRDLPVVGTYALGVANIRYYALWPATLFYPTRFTYLEVVLDDEAKRALPPFGDDGRPAIGWWSSREVREGVMRMRAAQGTMPEAGWRRYYSHLAAQYYDESGECPRELRAYSIEVFPQPPGQDLRQGMKLLNRAVIDCRPEPELRYVSTL